MGTSLSTPTVTKARDGDVGQPVTPDVEAFLSDVVKAACKLVVDHNVKQSTIQKHITEAVLDAAQDLPPLQVLYCSQHGSFDYSEAFNAFAASYPRPSMQYRTQTPSFRVEHVPVIAAFGKHACENWPVLGNMMYAYFHHGFKMYEGMGYNCVLDWLHFSKTEVENCKTRLTTVQRLMDAGLHGNKSLGAEDMKDMTESYSNHDLLTSQYISQLDPASQSALAEAMKSRVEQAEAAFLQRRAKVQGEMAEPALLDAMIEHVEYLWPEEQAERQKPEYSQKNWARKQPYIDFEFLEAVEHYGSLT